MPATIPLDSAYIHANQQGDDYLPAKVSGKAILLLAHRW